jgi:hypothetical protein
MSIPPFPARFRRVRAVAAAAACLAAIGAGQLALTSCTSLGGEHPQSTGGGTAGTDGSPWRTVLACLRQHGYTLPDPSIGPDGKPQFSATEQQQVSAAVKATGSACTGGGLYLPPLTGTAKRLSQTFTAAPLTDLGRGTYKGFTGGLYPNGSNTMPPAHASAGVSAAQRIQPLDTRGKPDSRGKIVLLSIGMSNASAEWCGTTTCLSTAATGRSFMVQAAASPAVNHQTLAVVNGARGGQVASTWASPTAQNYDIVRDQQLAPLGLTEAQVQVVWLKEADLTPQNVLPSSTADAYSLERLMGDDLRALKVRYPNLEQVFLSSRVYGGYATDVLNPEPFAYESGFSVKWLIQAQIQQMKHNGAISDPRAGNLDYNSAAPWIAWGPYLWADGTHPRSDGLNWQRSDFGPDGTHPSATGIAKVETTLLSFFLNSPDTRCWFRTPAQHARCSTG